MKKTKKKVGKKFHSFCSFWQNKPGEDDEDTKDQTIHDLTAFPWPLMVLVRARATNKQNVSIPYKLYL